MANLSANDISVLDREFYVLNNVLRPFLKGAVREAMGTWLSNLYGIASGALTGIVTEGFGGFGMDVGGIGFGIVKRTAPATYSTVPDSITVSAGTGLSGGGTFSLGSSATLNVVYGTIIGTATQGNDVRLNPVPSAAGRVLYDSGLAWTALAAGTANFLFQSNGAAAPSWVSTLTGISISGSTNTLTNIGNSSLVNSSLTVTAGTGLSGGGVVSLGGSVSLSANFGTTAGTITQGNDVRLVPTGALLLWGTASPPTGWVFCDGSAISRTTYSALFALYGTTFGSGDGSTTFNVPDFRGRFPLGKAAAGTGSTLGGTGGTIDHTHGSPLTTSGPSATVTATPLLVAAASGTHTHSVTVPADNPPFLAINFIVKT